MDEGGPFHDQRRKSTRAEERRRRKKAKYCSNGVAKDTAVSNPDGRGGRKRLEKRNGRKGTDQVRGGRVHVYGRERSRHPLMLKKPHRNSVRPAWTTLWVCFPWERGELMCTSMIRRRINDKLLNV